MRIRQEGLSEMPSTPDFDCMIKADVKVLADLTQHADDKTEQLNVTSQSLFMSVASVLNSTTRFQ